MHSQSPLDTLWRPASLGWCILGGQAIALLLSLAPGVSGSRLIWFGLNSLVALWIVLVSSAALYAARSQLKRLPTNAAIFCAVLIVVAASIASASILWHLFFQDLANSQATLPDLLIQAGSLALLLGLMASAALQSHLRQRELATLASQAQLQALQARIRPHFLFNTLNSAVALVRSEPARAENLLIDMADLFRSALSPASTITLAEEIDLCRRYIAIEQARFGDRLQTHWQLPDPLPALAIPPLCLQPLVENAVHHGVERSHGSSLIQIHARLEQDRMVIDIGNPLHAAGARHHHGHGVGLEAVRARLAAYSEQTRLETWQADGHFHARLQLPLGDQVTTR